jgi:acetyl/propionyl-CoA carboxylase alpha subunit
MRSPPGSSERRLGVLATQVTKPLRPATRAQDRLPACLRPEFVSAGGLDAFDTVLVANRGEIAIRIFRAATDLGLKTVAVYSSDDALALHTKAADVAVALDGDGVPPYLDIEGVIAAAKQSGANAIHPGYGLLSENSEFAHRCGEEGIVWIGPPVEMLELFGDKSAAREAAASADVPVPRGIDRAISLEECHDFFASVADDGGIMIKAIAGAGGRGSRKVTAAEDVAEAFAACQNEATIAFGNGELYVEEYVTNARHIEVQILADQYGGVCELGERECSVQRKFQKIVEIAPAAHLDPSMRKQIIDASVRLAKKVGYSIIGTPDCHAPLAFIPVTVR